MNFTRCRQNTNGREESNFKGVPRNFWIFTKIPLLCITNPGNKIAHAIGSLARPVVVPAGIWQGRRWRWPWRWGETTRVSPRVWWWLESGSEWRRRGGTAVLLGGGRWKFFSGETTGGTGQQATVEALGGPREKVWSDGRLREWSEHGAHRGGTYGGAAALVLARGEARHGFYSWAQLGTGVTTTAYHSESRHVTARAQRHASTVVQWRAVGCGRDRCVSVAWHMAPAREGPKSVTHSSPGVAHEPTVTGWPRHLCTVSMAAGRCGQAWRRTRAGPAHSGAKQFSVTQFDKYFLHSFGLKCTKR
jgi:hypothetical protein